MTDRPVIFSTAPLSGPGVATLQELGDLIVDPWIDQQPLRLYNEEQLAARATEVGATILICEADKCGGPVLDLPLIAIGSTRGDPTNVDLDGATAKGIPVLRAPGRNADGVAELAVGLLLAVTRHLVTADRDVREGEVYRDGSIPYQRFRGWELAGRTAGIVGLGANGRALAWRLEGLGMKVVSHDPYAPDATHTLEDLLAESEVVSMHAPVTPDTKGMIGAEELKRMKEGAIYLNAARAALHDTGALVDALQNGHLAAAGLDHFEGERLAAGHPLLDLPNVVLTPHIGGASYDTEANHARMMGEGIAAVLRGDRPAHCVNPEVLG